MKPRQSVGVAVVTVLLLMAPDATAAPVPVVGPTGSSTVETLAGPGFCDGPSSVDPDSLAVRALAVGPQGIIHVETGRADRGVVAQIAGLYARPRLLRTKGPGGLDPSPPPLPEAGRFPLAGRLASDGAGGAFVASGDRLHHIPATQPVAPVSAPGSPGAPPSPTPDDPALQARFRLITTLASDENGNVFVADELAGGSGAVAVRFVNRSLQPVTFYPNTPHELTVAPGSIGSVAGAPGDANVGDGGPATLATVSGSPSAMAVAGDRLYVAAFGVIPGVARPQVRLRMVNLGGEAVEAHGMRVEPGMIDTVAGGGPAGTDGEGGAALAADVSPVPGMAADAEGNLYLADPDHHRVRRIDPDGVVLTVAGTAVGLTGGGFNGNELPATRALLDQPYDVKLGPAGLYISDSGNGQIRVVDAGGTIRTLVGSGLAPWWTCDGEQPSAGEGPDTDRPRMGPAAIVVHPDGNLYFVAASAGRVMRLDRAGTVSPVTDPGGIATSCTPATACPPEDAEPSRPVVQRPAGLAPGPHGGLYVADGGDNRVLFYNLGPNPVTVHGVTVGPGELEAVAGDGTLGSSGDGGPAIEAQLSGGGSVVADSEGNLLIADRGNARVRQVDRRGRIDSLLGGDDAAGSPCCAQPSELALDGADNLYITDGRQVWFLNREPGPVTVQGQTVAPGAVQAVAGSGGYGFDGDGGPALEAQFQAPQGVAAGGDGSLYVADAGEDGGIRHIDKDGLITTVVGAGASGFNGDGLQGRLSQLHNPTHVALDPCGNLLIADAGNDRVRRLNTQVPCAPVAATSPVPPSSQTWWLVAGGGIVLASATFAVVRTRHGHQRLR